jgi:hypothetical protein
VVLLKQPPEGRSNKSIHSHRGGNPAAAHGVGRLIEVLSAFAVIVSIPASLVAVASFVIERLKAERASKADKPHVPSSVVITSVEMSRPRDLLNH